jgi:hypothetical protein
MYTGWETFANTKQPKCTIKYTKANLCQPGAEGFFKNFTSDFSRRTEEYLHFTGTMLAAVRLVKHRENYSGSRFTMAKDKDSKFIIEFSDDVVDNLQGGIANFFCPLL